MKPTTKKEIGLLIKNRKNIIILLALCILFLSFSTFLVSMYLIPYNANAYKSFVQEGTSGIIVTQPYKIQSYISKLAPEYTKWIKQIPRFTSLQPGPIRLEWFHNLPREISLVFNYFPNVGHEVFLIVNEKKNSTIFVNEVNDSGFLRHLCFTKWDSLRVAPYKSSIWFGKGYVHISSETQTSRRQTSQRVPLSNNHLIEIYWDNSYSDLSTLKELILSCYKPRGITPYLPCLDYLSIEILWLYLYLNLIEDDLIKGNLKVSSSANYEYVDSCINKIFEWIQKQIPNDVHLIATFRGLENGTITYEVEFSKFEQHLRKALGNN